MTLTRQMREPRKAKPIQAAGAWYYVNPRSIDVFVQSKNGATPSCQLTHRQLRQALAIMQTARRRKR